MTADAASRTDSPPPRLTLIDGSGFIFRAFFALPSLSRSDGTPTGAVYGFVTMLLKLLDDRRHDGVTDHVAVIFDAGRHTFRNELYSEYKANRDEPPEELRPQFALVREATEAMNLPSIELAGFEADDLIASYTRAGQAQGFQVDIVSSDKDLMQLVDDASHIRMVDAMKNKVINEAAVQEKFGVAPPKVLDVLSLMGDSSDNVPGVPGIGPKTATQLITEYGDLDSLLARAEEIKQNKRRESLIEHADNARLSRELITLKEDVDLPLPLAELALKEQDTEKLTAFLHEMEFKKLVTRVTGTGSGGASSNSSSSRLRGEVRRGAGSTDAMLQAPPPTRLTASNEAEVSLPSPASGRGIYSLIQSENDLQRWISQVEATGQLALTLETEGETLIGLSLAIQPGEAAYVPLAHVEASSQDDLFDSGSTRRKGQLEASAVLAALTPLLQNPSILKIGWRCKEDIMQLLAHGISLTPVDDICLISYCLGAGAGSHSFDEIVKRELDTELCPVEDLLGKGRNKITFAQTDFNEARDPAAQKADFTLRLWQILKPRLFAERLTTPYERFERPLLPIMAQMQAEGVLVDRERLHQLSTEFRKEQDGLAQEVFAQAGKEFTIGSPKQLGEVLFDHMGIEGGKRSKKSGQYSTGVEVLEELAAQGHVIAEKVLSWRQYDKLRSTYTEALDKQINPKTGRVHTTFQQTVAATGRLSSTDPNLQNIPIRTEAGRRIRKAFIAAEGYQLLSADYSQIELRLLAEMADIQTLKEAFKQKRDIHATTASQMFGVPLEEMTPDLRRKAKTINFGIIYGISAHGLAVRLGIDRAEAAKFIDAYFEHYPGIRRYMEAKKLEARENGYVTSLFGRRIHVPNINQKNYQLRAFAERQAINAPLQSTAADIIKRAMVQISSQLPVVSCQSFKDNHSPLAGESNPSNAVPKDLVGGKPTGNGITSPPTGSSASAALRQDSPAPPRGGSSTSPPLRLLLQVHDELLFEIKQGEEDRYAPKIKQIMEQAAHLSIPLTVETGIGQDWGEIH